MLFLKNQSRFEQLTLAVALLFIATVLHLSSLYSYLLFHSLIEVVTVSIAFMLFIITWNARGYLENNYLRILGIGYAFIALIDLTHTLAYKGINVFKDYGVNLSAQLWITARYLQAITLCAAPFFIKRRLYDPVVVTAYTVAVMFFLFMVFSGNFPDCFIEEKGLTSFKVNSEYLITAFLFASMYLLYRKREHFNQRVFHLTISSIIFTALSEISFITYVSMYGFANMLGHYFKLAAFYLIYRAILVTGIREPFELIFRELNEAKDKLQNIRNNLEEEVRERTEELQQELAEHRRTEERLIKSEERLRVTLETVQIGIFDWDVESDIWEASPECYTILGYEPQTGPGNYTKWLQQVHPDDRQYLESKITAIYNREPSAKQSPVYEHETRLRHASGEYRWEYIKGFGITFNEKGDVTRILGIMMDINERKTTEIKLVGERSLLRCIIDSVSDLIFFKDRNGAYQGCNKASEEFIGMPESEQIGKTDFDFFDHKMAEEVQKADRNVIEKGEPLYVEEWITTRDGKLQLMDTCKSPYYDPDGEALGIVGISRDITDRKKAEEEIRTLNLELEQRVKDRTAELESSNKELESFVYSISHDLRAPLRHIDGFMELMKKNGVTSLNEKGWQHMDRVSASAQKMGHLIDDLLSFSRIGRQEMTLKEIDLGLIVRKIIKKLNPETAGREIQWIIGDFPSVRGDRILLEIVMMNLLSNAIKFTREKEQAIIEAGSEPSEGETVIFVRDNGVGFEQEYADNLFGVFQRLHSADEFEGTGAGLAMVQRIIHRHGGRVWAEGEVDKGAVFYFSLS
jgi:PAS domain S-box-containing protein